MDNKFYITTTLPYVNSKPHIGFALEIIQADVIARYKSLLGYDVFFNTGTDEHGQKIYKKAIEEKKDPQKYVDEYASKFDDLKRVLNLSYNNFIRTTDENHKKAAQEMWIRCTNFGFIEKGIYKAKYCIGCELEKQESELVDGKCPLHPTENIEEIEEENYFFKFSKFQDKLLELYKKYPDYVIPVHRLKEINNFVTSGLQDFSVSRLKEKMPWGVEVPNDSNHVMYVWFDALTNYISALGWPENEKKFNDYWGTLDSPKAVQVAGKDNLRQQSSMWQAMLMAAGLPPTRQIFIHGFITSGGQKMSKSIGNIIDPIEYAQKYSTDALRYYLLAKVSPAEDSDFTKEKFEAVYNADLANGLGNLIARVSKLCELNDIGFAKRKIDSFSKTISKAIENYSFDSAMEGVWKKVNESDVLINKHELWKGTRNKSDMLTNVVDNIKQIAYDLKPFLPDTSEKIETQFSNTKVESDKPLFPRLK